MVERGDLSMGQARALLGLEGGAAAIEKTALRVVSQQLSVRQVEALVRKTRGETNGSAHAGTRSSAAVRDLDERLARALGTRVRVVDQGGRGRIEIEWTSLDELDRLLDTLLGPKK
jgi:ParB family chromosome partitioning protein